MRPMDGQEKTVFVYGAMRSGTTVFRLMLNAHPGIANPGEADFLFEFLIPDPGHPTGWRYDLPRMRVNRIFQSYGLEIPAGCDGLDLLASFLAQFRARSPGRVLTLNLHRRADRIRAVLPEARFIHMLRDPRDVARSSIGMGWARSLYHGVDHWIGTERAWDRAMQGADPGLAMTLTYEDLFRDIEGELGRVCAFIGVAYAPEMLRYHENTTYDPPDPTLVQQWRRKCSQAEIDLLEGKAGALMAARGYAPTGPGRVPGALARAGLRARQKAFVWGFAMRRYGTGTFLAERAAWHLGLSRPHRRVRQRMNAIDVARLK